MSEFRFYISFWILILSFSNLILFFKFIKTSLPRLPFPCDEGYMWSLYVCDDTKIIPYYNHEIVMKIFCLDSIN